MSVYLIYYECMYPVLFPSVGRVELPFPSVGRVELPVTFPSVGRVELPVTFPSVDLLSYLQGQSLLEAQQSTVEVFGRWQTEEYIAHPIVDVSCQLTNLRVSVRQPVHVN